MEYPSPQGTGTMKGYLVRPAKAAGKLPGIIVIHENRGLNPHIKDVARRVAQAGFLAIAPNALSPLGGTPANEDDARSLFKDLDAAESLENFSKAFDYLATRPDCNGYFGCVGFSSIEIA